jgi:hypothetical protein
MYFDVTSDPAKNKALMQRFLRENLAVETNIQASRRRPQPPRNLSIVKSLTDPHLIISWVAPQSASGIVGYNVYQNNENNRIQNIANPNTLSFTVVLLSATYPIGFYVSSYTALLESVKVQIIAS